MKTKKKFYFNGESIEFNNKDYLAVFVARCERQGDCYDDLDLVDVEVDNVELYLDTEEGNIPVDINDLSNYDYKLLINQLEEYVEEQKLDWIGEEIVDEYADFNRCYDEYSGKWV